MRTLPCALAVLVLASATLFAQPPGWPRPGMRPPGMPQHPGMHGSSGMHAPAGMHTPAGMHDFSHRASTHQPGIPQSDMSPPGMHDATPPSFPEHRTPEVPRFGPMFEMVYTCNGCGKEVGRGTQPDVANCPHCGVRFNNTASGMIATSQEQINSATGGWNSSSTTGGSSDSGGYGRVRVPVKLIVVAVGAVVVGVGFLIGLVKAAFGTLAPKPKRKKIKRPSWDD